MDYGQKWKDVILNSTENKCIAIHTIKAKT